MKNDYHFALRATLSLTFLLMFWCTPVPVQRPPEEFVPSCIQGTVFYRTPADSTPMPYPFATVSAWRHETEQGLAETQTDGQGNYCIEVPVEDFRIELRVWGLQRLEGTTYTCKGSVDNIDSGTNEKRCGEDCLTIDITTDCEEYHLPRHRQM